MVHGHVSKDKLDFPKFPFLQHLSVFRRHYISSLVYQEPADGYLSGEGIWDPDI